jgi:hypothetical protein
MRSCVSWRGAHYRLNQLRAATIWRWMISCALATSSGESQRNFVGPHSWKKNQARFKSSASKGEHPDKRALDYP